MLGFLKNYRILRKVDILQLINIFMLCKFLSEITFSIRAMPYFVEGTADSSSETGFSSFIGWQTL